MQLLVAASIIDPKQLLSTFGVAGLVAVIFAETGLLLGFFLPGDSLLVLAGLICAVGTKKAGINIATPNLGVVLVGLLVAAIVGSQVGYLIGRKAGPAMFNRPNSRFFKHEHVEKAQRYFDRYGAKTIVIARFVPIVRTFASPMAGVADMDRRTFTLFNVIGAAAWVVSVTMLGFVLGKSIPGAENHLFVIEGIIIVLSLLPVAIELLRARRAGRAVSPAP